ncbi:YciE/YciF ferroxidase family protein [Hymenobacter metallicola]|uniref:Ferritin-like domain-containing protein n=1 Tax=Hymenobacter metallicola TaxID=2563114 RepID=A0A4Z0QD59_9BACT|nr:ferritin-like domain-containing protein [Hymenobacter metallicola]TGE27113.1 ferritin-like domain-containing protein [Hymenobacter metallicola]
MAQLKDLHDLLCHEVQAMYSAETLIVAGLPRMIEKAYNEELKHAFRKHLTETQKQVERLEEVAKLLDIDADGDGNPGMKGIIAEGEKVMQQNSESEVLDAALICGAQKIEHYEIAGYGTAVYLAKELGLDSVARILEATLEEEKTTNEILNNLAKNTVNPMAE